MTVRQRVLRILAGLGLVIVVLLAGFAIANSFIENWGTTPEERALVLPGDELLPNPVVRWTHAVTINAKPEDVWPWVIQMGDTRGGFYSYMFIERAVAGNSTLYVNADRVHPEWQNPPVGQSMITNAVAIREYAPNQYMLASALEEIGVGWTWLWHLSPASGDRTRLLIHMKIQLPPDAPNNPLITYAMNVGTFLMELDMIQGLKLRAEGSFEPLWTENVELALWFGALLVGLLGAVLFVVRKDWKMPLLTGLAAIVVLFVMVYVQPDLWLWVVMDVGLVGFLIIIARMEKTSEP